MSRKNKIKKNKTAQAKAQRNNRYCLQLVLTNLLLNPKKLALAIEGQSETDPIIKTLTPLVALVQPLHPLWKSK